MEFSQKRVEFDEIIMYSIKIISGVIVKWNERTVNNYLINFWSKFR